MSTIDLPFGARVEERADVFEADGLIGAIALHRPKALSRLLAQYRTATAITAISRALSDQAQALENAIIEVIVSRHLLYATGAQLDMLGAIVGERRDGKGDSLYRKFVQARVLINRSYGRVRDIVAVLQAVDSGTFTLTELGVASFQIVYTSPPSSQVARAAIPTLVRETRAIGIGASVVMPTRANYFRFSNYGAAPVSGRGFGNYGSPGVGAPLSTIASA
jgi:hypothetical protein